MIFKKLLNRFFILFLLFPLITTFCHTMDMIEIHSEKDYESFSFCENEHYKKYFSNKDNYINETLNIASCQIHWFQEVLIKLNDPMKSRDYIESLAFGAGSFSRSSEKISDWLYYQLLDESSNSIAKKMIAQLVHNLVYWKQIERCTKEKKWDELMNIALNIMTRSKLSLNTFEKYISDIKVENLYKETIKDNHTLNDLLLDKFMKNPNLDGNVHVSKDNILLSSFYLQFYEMEFDTWSTIVNILHSFKSISSDLASDIKTFPVEISKEGMCMTAQMGECTTSPEVIAHIFGLVFKMPASTKVSFDDASDFIFEELAKYPSVLGCSAEVLQKKFPITQKIKGNLIELPPKNERDISCIQYLGVLKQLVKNINMITLTYPSGYSPSFWHLEDIPTTRKIVENLHNTLLNKQKKLDLEKMNFKQAQIKNQPKAKQNKTMPQKNHHQNPQSLPEANVKKEIQNQGLMVTPKPLTLASAPQKPTTPTPTNSPALTPAEQRETFWLLQHIVLASVQEQVFSTFPLTIYWQILFYHVGDILMPGSSIALKSLGSRQNRLSSPLVRNKKPASQQCPVLKNEINPSPKDKSNLPTILENPSRYSGKKTYRLKLNPHLINSLTDADKDLLCDLYHDPRNLHSYYRWQDFINLIDHMGGTIKIVGGVESCTFSWLQTNNRFNVHPPHGANGKLYDVGFADFSTSGLTRVLGIEKL